MASLRQAHVQTFYRPIMVGFVGLAVVIIIGVVYASSGHTLIRVTPEAGSVTTTFTVTVGPATDTPNHVPGTVETKEISSSVTVTPSSDGAEIPAQATGTVTIINSTSSDQPLAAGTRLQHENGVIVRTTARLDVPARGRATATAIADPVGASGNLPPGKFIIVALRPANQALIFGESTEPFTGGLRVQSGSLSLNALTAASNEAEMELRKSFGESTVGTFKLLEPVAVATTPEPDIPAANYTVTVTMKAMTISYDADILSTLIRTRLTTLLKEDQEIVSIENPKVMLDSQPSLESAAISVTSNGITQLRADSALLAPSQFVGLDQEAITKKLLGSSLVSNVTVAFTPWWHTAAGQDPETITVERVLP